MKENCRLSGYGQTFVFAAWNNGQALFDEMTAERRLQVLNDCVSLHVHYPRCQENIKTFKSALT